MWQRELAAIALGGAAGAVMRFVIATGVQRWSGALFPWGVFAVNMLGCLAFGWLATLAERKLMVSPEARGLLLIGFLGAFTTFSTYAHDIVRLASSPHGSWTLAAANLIAHNVLGVLAVLWGASLGRRW